MQRFRLVHAAKANEMHECTSGRCAVGSHPSNDLVARRRRRCRASTARCASSDRGARGARPGQPQRHLRRRRARARGGTCSTAACCARPAAAALRAARRDQPAAGLRRAAHFGPLVGASVADARACSRCSSAPPHRRDRAARGRDRHRQGARRRGDPRGASARRRAVRRRRLRRDPGERCSRASCSATRRARSPARSRGASARSKRRDGGTMFLDEIGELPLELQPKLLRVLETGEIRRVGGNHRSRRSTCASSPRPTATCAPRSTPARFRDDLYFRLAVVKVTLPPLRERTRGHCRCSSTRCSQRLGATARQHRRAVHAARSSTALAAARLAGQRARAAQLPRALPGVRGAAAAGGSPTRPRMRPWCG